MKKQILLFVCLFPVLAVLSQTPGSGMQNGSMDINQVNVRDMAGKLITSGAYEIKGSPFLSDSWGKGYVKFSNGKFIKETTLLFDIFTNELYYKLDDQQFAFVDPVIEFSLTYEENDRGYSRLFRNSYPGDKLNSGKLFYEVLYDGAKLQLLKRTYKSIEEVSGYGVASSKSFKQVSELYVFDPQQGSLKLIKNKKPLTESAPELASMTAKLPGNEKGKFSSEKELIDLFIRLNSQ